MPYIFPQSQGTSFESNKYRDGYCWICGQKAHDGCKAELCREHCEILRDPDSMTVDAKKLPDVVAAQQANRNMMG